MYTCCPNNAEFYIKVRLIHHTVLLTWTIRSTELKSDSLFEAIWVPILRYRVRSRAYKMAKPAKAGSMLPWMHRAPAEGNASLSAFISPQKPQR